VPLQHTTCPDCGRDGRWLEDSSRQALVNYYRCDHCGCVWNIRKDDPAWTTIVTQPGRSAEGC
jgi:hypothetical protein